MHRILFRLGFRPRPRWGSSQRSPRPPGWILRGPTSKGRQGEKNGRARKKRRGVKGGGQKGKGQKGKERERKGKKGRKTRPPNWNFWLRHCGWAYGTSPPLKFRVVGKLFKYIRPLGTEKPSFSILGMFSDKNKILSSIIIPVGKFTLFVRILSKTCSVCQKITTFYPACCFYPRRCCLRALQKT